MFNIDIEPCQACGGPVGIIACIEDPVVIKKLLDHLQDKGEFQDAVRWPDNRAPPQASVFDWEKTQMHDRDVAGNTGQGRRSDAGVVWADQRADLRPDSLVRPPHPLRLATPGGEMTRSTRGGQGDFSAERGSILAMHTHYTPSMNMTLSIAPLVALIAGILILAAPRLLNYIVAIYLIVVGLLGLFGVGGMHIR